MKKIFVDFNAVQKVVSYLEHDEHLHYDSYEKRPKNHIWISVKKLKDTISQYNWGKC